MTKINVDLVLGRKVRSRNGVSLGRIEAIDVVRHGDSWVISEFHIGPDALLERLAVTFLPRLLREAVQRACHSRRHRIAWHQIDIMDPRHPRLICDDSKPGSQCRDASAVKGGVDA
ncbi:hypothetical protein [Caballeronia sp. S22]|uniref:hypothetical protein n=1 Tax=Caballeronia sp. S22 TaxID=3137182 RepID=UPI003530C902